MKLSIELFIFSFCLLYSVSSVAQVDTLLFQKYDGQNVSWHSNINGSVYTGVLSSVPQKSYLYKDGRSLGYKNVIKSPIHRAGKNVYFIDYNSDTENMSLVKLSEDGIAVDSCLLKGKYAVLTDQSGVLSLGDELFEFQIENCSSLVKISIPEDLISRRELIEITNLDKGGYVLTFGVMEQGYTDFLYIVMKDGKQQIIDPEQRFKDPDFYLEFIFYDDVNETFYCKTSRYNHEKGKLINNDLILDKNLDPVSTVLKKEPFNSGSSIGYNLYDGSLISVNVKSLTDSSKPVVISYRFNSELEFCIRNLYLDSVLTFRDLGEFGFYELQILLNAIYAKHNYYFKSEYLQGYFNLFNFYTTDNKRLNRNMSVDHLLTVNDKKNRKLILDRLEKEFHLYSNFQIK